MMKVVFPGSFDPPTNGHLNVMQRASRLFDELWIVVANNQGKRYLFTAEERSGMIQNLVAELPNVKVTIWEGLIVEFTRRIGARTILRGVRALADFEFEFELSMMNRALDQGIETLFMPTDQKYFVLRSSAIKELAMFKGDVTGMVPPIVAEALRAKFSKPVE